jgi:hypothetical protein
MANFSTFNKTTTNITATLREAAKDRHISKEEVDFDLLTVETLIQSEKYKEWTIIEEPLEKTFDENTINSPALLIRQEYQIRVRPYTKDILEQVDIDIAFNKAKSKVVATFKKGSIFPCNDKLASLLKREINRKKLRIGFLIGHFEGKLNATLVKLAKVVTCNTPLPKDIRISIAEFSGASYPSNDAIILHYKENESSKKSMVSGVNPDTLIFEYIKPIFGNDGRACTGELIIVPQPKVVYDRYHPDTDTVLTQENEKSVKYYSKIDGYVKNSNYEISISKEIRMESATFRNSQSIDTGEDKDVSVNIHHKNKSDDAIGSGVVMNVKELNVKGTVGANATVRAQELNVGEQTHRNAKLEAIENATIHLHRGNLKAKTATIEILENGTVKADTVHVKKMLGGEIIAHKVFVEELTSNTTIIASESIEIGLITGEHNKLIIDPDKIEDYHEKISLLKTKIKESHASLKEIQDEYAKRVSEHQAELPRIKVFQKRCLVASQQGKTPNKTDLLRIKHYKKKSADFESELLSHATQEKEIEKLNNELEKLYEAELHATITNKGLYDGHTQVLFVDVKTSQEYTMLPQGSYEKLHLVKDGDEKKIAW